MSLAFVRRNRVVTVLLVVGVCALGAAWLHAPDAAAQSAQASAGRGAPVPVALPPYDGYPEEHFVGSVTPW